MDRQLNKTHNKSKNIKLILQICFFVVLTIFAIIYVLKDDPKETFKILLSVNFFPLSFAIFVIFITILLDSLSLKLLTNIFNRRYTFKKALANTMSSGVVSVFAKTASPIIQAYTFSKQNVSPSNSASILTMNFLVYQFSLNIYSIIIVTCCYPIMKDIEINLLAGFKLIYLVLIGLSIQILFVVLICLLGFCRPLHRLFLNSGINLLAKLHILRDSEKTRRKLTIQFATYRIEMKRLSKHMPTMLCVFLINCTKLFLLGIIPFLCFCSLIPSKALNADFFIQSLAGTGYSNVIGSYITVGAPEVVFQDTFSQFLSKMDNISDPKAISSACNILWRTLTFYLIFILGLLTFIFYRGDNKKYKLLSNTATIYDLALTNFDEADSETKDYLNEIHHQGKKTSSSLLSEKQVEDSFKEIRDIVLNSNNKIIHEDISEDESLNEILQEQKKKLAAIEKEFQDLVNQMPSKEEIDNETQADIQFHEKKVEKKRDRKIKHILKKNRKETLKEEKELLKRQPKGTTMSLNEDNGIDFKGPEFKEIKTYTTHDPDEDNK